MSALNATNPTLIDVARRTDPDGKIATIVELSFYRAGKAISEDAFVSGSPRRADDMDAAKRMFPTMN